MPGLVPIRCDGYEVTQAPGTVVYSDCQHKLPCQQGCISCGTCSYLELTEDHVLTSE